MAYAKVRVAGVTGGTQLVSSQLSLLPAVKSDIVSPDYQFSVLCQLKPLHRVRSFLQYTHGNNNFLDSPLYSCY